MKSILLVALQWNQTRWQRCNGVDLARNDAMAALISDLPLLVIMNLASGDLAGSTCQGEELSRFYYYNFLLQVCYCEFAVASLLLRVCRCEFAAASLLLRVEFAAASYLRRVCCCELRFMPRVGCCDSQPASGYCEWMLRVCCCCKLSAVAAWFQRGFREFIKSFCISFLTKIHQYGTEVLRLF